MRIIISDDNRIKRSVKQLLRADAGTVGFSCCLFLFCVCKEIFICNLGLVAACALVTERLYQFSFIIIIIIIIVFTKHLYYFIKFRTSEYENIF